jgi:hypothetical protein
MPSRRSGWGVLALAWLATAALPSGCRQPPAPPPPSLAPVCVRASLPLEAHARALRIEDVDGDGHEDLVLLQEDGFVVLFLGRGDQTFAPPRKYAVGPTPRDVAIADLDGDQKKDLLVVGHFANALTVLMGLGGGAFREAITYPLGNHSQQLRVTDLDADGHLDVVTKNAGSAGLFNITVLRGHGDGSFAAAEPYPTTGVPRDLDIADIDSDGRVDILVSISNQNVVDVFRGKGDGTLLAPTQLALSEDPLDLQLLDVNGDSLVDLLVSQG